MQGNEIVRLPVAVFTLVRPSSEIPLGAAVRRRVKLLEVRLDRFGPEAWRSVVAEARRDFPSARLLLTIRFAKDGGAWPDGVSRRDALAQALSLAQWDYLDVEWDAPDWTELEPLVRRHLGWTRLVVSRHDFVPAPEGLDAALDGVWKAALARGAAVAKWAGVLSDPTREADALYAFASLHSQETTVPAVFAMGADAMPTRVAAALLGGGWSYGHDGVGEAAPGQLPWTVLDALLQSLPAANPCSQAWLEAVERAIRLAVQP
jgi:3-dehydroquinate dehydratase type I